MHPRFLKLIRWVLLIVVTAAAFATTPASSRSLPGTHPNPLARDYPQVRLRKLHLVRPDLIPYPVLFEVYC